MRIWNPRTYYRYPSIFDIKAIAHVASNEAWHIRVPDPEALDRKHENDFSHFNNLTRKFISPNTAFPAISGILKSENIVTKDASKRNEENEFRKILRWCFPKVLIDEFLFNNPEHNKLKEYKAWINRFISKSTFLFSFKVTRPHRQSKDSSKLENETKLP